MAVLKRNLEEEAGSHENTLAEQRHKHSQELQQLNEQHEQIKKAKAGKQTLKYQLSTDFYLYCYIISSSSSLMSTVVTILPMFLICQDIQSNTSVNSMSYQWRKYRLVDMLCSTYDSDWSGLLFWQTSKLIGIWHKVRFKI